jgi:predicted HTH domain antitoxin
MRIEIDIPNDIAQQIQNQWRDLPQKLLEILAVEAYKTGAITRGQIQQMLKLSSLYEVDGLLKQAGAYLHYDEADFEQDLLTLQRLKIANESNS